MSPVIRIVLRYLAMFLVMKGVLDAKMAQAIAADPEVVAWLQMVIGAIVGGVTELWYVFARKFGWAK